MAKAADYHPLASPEGKLLSESEADEEWRQVGQ